MNQTELEQIVELVTRQVLAAVNAQPAAGGGADDRRSCVLVLGGDTAREEELNSGSAEVLGLDDYEQHRNILRYDRVVIARLTLTQLVDISNGRVGDSVSCAVIHALLSGVDTVIREDAYPHRKFAGKGSTALYQLLEKCAQSLQTFGIKPVGRSAQTAACRQKPSALSHAPAQPECKPERKRLITEADARAMVRQGSCVELPADAILTPSARDVLNQARKDRARTPGRNGV